MDPRGRGALLRLSKNAEDVADGLITFREGLPNHTVRITAIIEQLFALSTVLQALHLAQRDRRFEASFHRVRQDLQLVYTSLARTLHACFDMFGRTSLGRSYDRLWADLLRHMDHEEDCGLFGRLELYVDYLTALRCIVTGMPTADIHPLRAVVGDLLEVQDIPAYSEQGNVDLGRRPSLGRPRRSGPPPGPMPARPASAVYPNDRGYEPFAQQAPPEVPYAPYPTYEPYSPVFTSGSSEPLLSSHTSYSGTPAQSTRPPPTAHWALEVFDGSNPGHIFRGSSKSLDPSTCYGVNDPHALDSLSASGFTRVLEQGFDSETLWVRLYCRPPDSRARILIMTRFDGRSQKYSTALSNLKVIRVGSCLRLCKLARASGAFELWANLNFGLYERMVLFYNTFVAMKRQDSRPVPHANLLDDHELITSDYGDVELFGGRILSGTLQHALRIFKDRGSGVVRLEACARRGPMKDVPLWTAFITHYKDDPDHVMLETRRVVSFAALRPAPYIFLPRFDLPRNGNGEYILEFLSSDDARQFVENWHSLRRMTSMHFR